MTQCEDWRVERRGALILQSPRPWPSAELSSSWLAEVLVMGGRSGLRPRPSVGFEAVGKSFCPFEHEFHIYKVSPNHEITLMSS